MTSMLFTSQIILLAIGFGVGYWFLIKANTNEQYLRSVGEALGWVLIGVTVLLAICNFFYSIMLMNVFSQQANMPINTSSPGADMQQQQPVINQQQQEEEQPETNDEGVTNTKPVSSDIHDHT